MVFIFCQVHPLCGRIDFACTIYAGHGKMARDHILFCPVLNPTKSDFVMIQEYPKLHISTNKTKSPLTFKFFYQVIKTRRNCLFSGVLCGKCLDNHSVFFHDASFSVKRINTADGEFFFT